MNKTPAYDPIDERYWDPQDLRSEVERVFKLCADCRLCNKFCGSFPKLFEAVDSYCTDEKYFEVEIEKFKTEDLKEVVNLCFQCKLCHINCPYTPGDHEWAIDFPRLIARAKAQEVKKNGVSLTDRVMGNPDLVGKLASWTAPIANWANENKVHRLFMQGALGIHKSASANSGEPILASGTKQYLPGKEIVSSVSTPRNNRNLRFADAL